ncbi:MAG TPA: SpoIIE family protein phosphatase [Acidimicrobiales bacterium]|nr:SpoIIE family protein phosphatase [Acidimicrobiales bacterium]
MRPRRVRWLTRRGGRRPDEGQHERELLVDRLTRLQELTAHLAVAGSVDEVVDTAVHMLQHAVGARAASFCRLDGDTIRIEGSIGYPDEITERWCEFALAEDVPLAEAIRTGQPVLLPARDDVLRRYPHLASSMVWGESTAVAALPLRGESAVFGAIGVSFKDERDFDPALVSFLVAATTQCATAYERALSFESERSARHAAEAANRRLEFLSSATAILSTSLDPAATMQRLAELAAPALGDWCAVHLVDGEYAHPVAMASGDPEATATVRDLSERHPIPISAPAGLGAVVRTGEPIVLRSVTLDAVRASTQEGELVDLLTRLRAITIIPMSFQGRVLGTMTLSNTTDREMTDDDIALAGELAARAAQAVTNARLYQDRARVASTLQASLLPTSPTIIPGVDVATRFVPAAEGLDVGGDFYDVFRLGTVEDLTPTWAIVIGDVRGKGADAAAITGIARATIRATALDERSPAGMLQRLNQVLLATAGDQPGFIGADEPRFCTACVITVTPSADAAELVVASGGHPLPYVVRADGRLEEGGRHGALIGVLPSPDIHDIRVHLGPGDAIVLYTDGVTERHDGARFFDEVGLEQVLAGCAGRTASETARAVEDATRGFAPSPPTDDIALVVARVPDPAGIGTIDRQSLPEGDHAAAVARQFVARTLELQGAAALVERAVLLTSELVTNALLHGLPTVHVDVLEVPDGYRIAVSDEHPRLPTPRQASRDDEHGRGLLLVEHLADRWGVDPRPPGKSVWFELRTTAA